MTAFPKPQRWKSKKYRDAARDQDCTMRLPGCQNNTETTVLAHRNGAGMGTKASDHDAADMCQFCHDRYDGRARASMEGGREFSASYLGVYFNRARLETIINRIERGVIR
jgi:hypothetical protein